MGKKKLSKKQRLKLKKQVSQKKKSPYRFSDYLILGGGVIAAVVVAVWGGYYVGLQADEESMTSAVRTIMNRAEVLKEKGDLKNAERILSLAVKKHAKVELLKVHLALVLIDQGELSQADTLLHSGVKKNENLRMGLQHLRDAYREKGQKEDIIRISKELVHLE